MANTIIIKITNFNTMNFSFDVAPISNAYQGDNIVIVAQVPEGNWPFTEPTYCSISGFSWDTPELHPSQNSNPFGNTPPVLEISNNSSTSSFGNIRKILRGGGGNNFIISITDGTTTYSRDPSVIIEN